MRRSPRSVKAPARPGIPARASSEGWRGWDAYAPFYDWENTQTLGRRDVPFWRRVAAGADGPVLELGCGTGRIAVPLARSGVRLVGLDRSESMLHLAARRARRRGRESMPQGPGRLALVRGDIRALPFDRDMFAMVLAPYGVLQSLLRERDLKATLDAVRQVLRPGGLFGVDLVPDVPRWQEYENRVQLRGRAAGGSHLTLIESVRQDRGRRLTTFEQRYRVRQGRRVSDACFELTFRTLTVRQMTWRIERAGFKIDAILGDYQGRPWDARADVWIMLARRT